MQAPCRGHGGRAGEAEHRRAEAIPHHRQRKPERGGACAPEPASPESRSPPPGGAQMFAPDVDGDGDADVVTSWQAHGYGLSWFEQTSS